MKKTHALIILDGWGLSNKKAGNAVKLAKTPNFDALKKQYPYTTLACSGEDVGLYKNQMGNSEVGHLNLGAGRIVKQDSKKISDLIKEKQFFNNKALKSAFSSQFDTHLMGLISNGGVHSQPDHLYALIDMAKARGARQVYLHLFTDGRDSSPFGSIQFIKELQKHLKKTNTGKIASVMGRFYAMDRDKNFDRTKIAYDALVLSTAQVFATDAIKAVKESHEAGITDEFVKPIVLTENGSPVAKIKPRDSIVFFNFRADRARQLVGAFCQKDFLHFETNHPKNLNLVCFTQYDKQFKNVKVAFLREELKNTLGQVLAKANKTQLRIAETTKYAHVTYFFNGGVEKNNKGENRILIETKQVKTFDLCPQMSADEIANKVLETATFGKYDFVLINFANCDMVGHTGSLEAAILAVEATDAALGKVMKHFMGINASVLITADHGNAEEMLTKEGEPHTAHTTNPVPLILVDEEKKQAVLRKDGRLGDIAPTILDLMGVKVPKQFYSNSLIVKQ